MSAAAALNLCRKSGISKTCQHLFTTVLKPTHSFGIEHDPLQEEFRMGTEEWYWPATFCVICPFTAGLEFCSLFWFFASSLYANKDFCQSVEPHSPNVFMNSGKCLIQGCCFLSFCIHWPPVLNIEQRQAKAWQRGGQPNYLNVCVFVLISFWVVIELHSNWV